MQTCPKGYKGDASAPNPTKKIEMMHHKRYFDTLCPEHFAFIPLRV